MHASKDNNIRPIVAVNVCNKVTGKCKAVYALLGMGIEMLTTRSRLMILKNRMFFRVDASQGVKE